MDIIDDDLLEGSEAFRVSIFLLSVPYGINLGSTTSTTVNIRDDDSKKLFIYTIYLLYYIIINIYIMIIYVTYVYTYVHLYVKIAYQY